MHPYTCLSVLDRGAFDTAVIDNQSLNQRCVQLCAFPPRVRLLALFLKAQLERYIAVPSEQQDFPEYCRFRSSFTPLYSNANTVSNAVSTVVWITITDKGSVLDSHPATMGTR